ncbi:hypothetical protein [Halobacterium sp. CBA1126]|uniref:hypothetical protein n=1 Tax=Halobacterium sp. CBA1126 TaxID=2668074 RepID=UPI0012F9CB9E|nr:hypothetical protein [Halobacterium sp. CBA1126]MUV61053.1 hypothetical protein [Halobacterium sp. CBA1126]
MHRRSYLGTLAAAALAGCVGAPAAGDEPTTGTTTDGFPYSLTNARPDDPPVDAVTVDVTVTEDFTADHPARLAVAFTNDADDERTFQFGSLVPWDGIRGAHDDEDAALYLSPGGDVVPDAPADDCWQATDGIALPAVMREATLDAGETVSREFDVLAAHDSQRCHPPGTYRFEDGNYLGEGWGFSVDVVASELDDEN